MPIDTRDWYREKKHDYKPPHETWKSYRHPKRKPPLGRIFLIFLVVACIVATAYTGYLLFTHQTNWIVGAIVFAADIGVLFWNISAFKKWRIGAGTIVPIFLVIAFLGATACAFGGVGPLSSAKNEVVSWFQNTGSQSGGTQPSPPSTYPAEISGHVIIAEKIRAVTAIPVPPSKDSDVFWIVEVSIKNNAYSDPVEVCLDRHPEGWELPIYKGWEIAAKNEVYKPIVASNIERVSIALGQAGKVIFHFTVPRTLGVGDAQVCYRGQEPYSYGKLSGSDKVAVYDWNLKAVEEGTREPDQYEQYFVKKEVTGHKKVGKIGDIDITEPVYKDIYMKLETVGHWEKATSGDATPSFGLEGQPTGFYWLVGFNVSEAPWVVNWGYEARKFTALDPVGTKATFDVSIFTKADFDRYFYSQDRFMLSFHLVGEYRGLSDKGVHCIVVQKTGDYVIVLKTKDVKDIVDWWVNIGVE